MIKYKYTKEYREDLNKVIVDFGIDKSLENGYLIYNSLGSDIFMDFKSVKEEIDKLFDLLLGKIALYECGGNVNIIRSNRDITKIEDIFIDEDEEDIRCELETIEFVKIILFWAKENYQYRNQRGILSTEATDQAISWIEVKYHEVNVLEKNKYKLLL